MSAAPSVGDRTTKLGANPTRPAGAVSEVLLAEPRQALVMAGRVEHGLVEG